MGVCSFCFVLCFSFHHHPARLAAGLDEGGQPGELGVLSLPTGELLRRNHLLLGHLSRRHRLVPLGVDHLVEPGLATVPDDGVLELADECDHLLLVLHEALGALEGVLAVLEELRDRVGLTADDLTGRAGGAALHVDAVSPVLPVSPRREPGGTLGNHLRVLPLVAGHLHESAILGLSLADRLIAPRHILHAPGAVREHAVNCAALDQSFVLLSGHKGKHADDQIHLRVLVVSIQGIQCFRDPVQVGSHDVRKGGDKSCVCSYDVRTLSVF